MDKSLGGYRSLIETHSEASSRMSERMSVKECIAVGIHYALLDACEDYGALYKQRINQRIKEIRDAG